MINNEKMTNLNWDGGYYQLTMYFSEKELSSKAMKALFLSPTFVDKFIDKHLQEKCEKLEDKSFYSLIQVNKKTIPCYVSELSFDDGTGEITIAIPIGSLGEAFDLGAYPFGEKDTSQWQLPTNETLKNIALDIYDDCKYKIAIVGFETFEDLYDIDEIISCTPRERWDGFLIPSGSEIKWFPPTQYKPQLT